MWANNGTPRPRETKHLWQQMTEAAERSSEVSDSELFGDDRQVDIFQERETRVYKIRSFIISLPIFSAILSHSRFHFQKAMNTRWSLGK